MSTYTSTIIDTPENGHAGCAGPLSEAEAGNWYALYTHPRHEKQVAYQIELRRMSCFLPLYRSVRRWKDRRKELEMALFPGYVFVCIISRGHAARWMPGVARTPSSPSDQASS